MRTFYVSDVSPPKLSLEATALSDVVRHRTKHQVVAGQVNSSTLSTCLFHPFVQAVHLSFAYHLPLTISPDDVWLCIAQGFACHVNGNAEELRPSFVSHPGKLDVSIRRDDFVAGAPDNDWAGAFSELVTVVSHHLVANQPLSQRFSTTGPVEQAALDLVMLSSLQEYFDYNVWTLCGIPEITLLGSPDDWRQLRAAAAKLTPFGVNAWIAQLLPVLDQFVDASKGNINLPFWRSMYKINEECGGDRVTGWINALFPYLGQISPTKNLLAWQPLARTPSPCMHDFPVGLARCPFTWNFLGDPISMVALAGFVGVAQHPTTSAIRPAIGWAVANALSDHDGVHENS